jgi:two-component system, chemotaxis family, sensor kinase CheA
VKGVRAYTGTTILGDGRVIMILDVPGIAMMTDVLSRTQDKSMTQDASEAESAEERGSSLLLFDAGVEAPRAVHLSQVARLEEFALADIEWADGRWVVQYRGELLPLLAASDQIDMRGADPRSAIVFTDGVHSMGLAVDEIRDIVREVVTIRAESRSEGLIGSIVAAGRTTELVDIDYYLARARMAPGHTSSAMAENATVTRPEPTGGDDSSRSRRVLLVDDSPFFLNMLGPVLRSHGFDVALSHDGSHALDRIQRGETFDAVVSDIDMPHLNGFELARKVRECGEHTMPMIALTSRDSEEDRLAGEEAGFDRYLMKFDQAEVVAAVQSVFEVEPETETNPEEVLV